MGLMSAARPDLAALDNIRRVSSATVCHKMAPSLCRMLRSRLSHFVWITHRGVPRLHSSLSHLVTTAPHLLPPPTGKQRSFSILVVSPPPLNSVCQTLEFPPKICPNLQTSTAPSTNTATCCSFIISGLSQQCEVMSGFGSLGLWSMW